MKIDFNPDLELDSILPFGKWKGVKVSAVIETDPQYLLWVNENVERYNVDPEVVRLAERQVEILCEEEEWDAEREENKFTDVGSIF
jgi:hypothetical protein